MDLTAMLQYCAELEANNDRGWFHAPEHHARYMAAKADFTGLVEELKLRLADVASPDLSEKLIFADPKALLYRVPRDMRTNKGKPPYNPRWGADLSGDRHSLLPVGYYVHLQPGDRSMFGTGAYGWNAAQLHRFRLYLSEHYDRFSDALAQAGLPMLGDRLKNVPRGFDPADPAAEYLKYKNWLAARSFPDRELTDAERFLDAAVETALRLEPLRRFFTDALSGHCPNPFDPADWG